MERRITSWFSPNLQMEMPLVAYGHSGQTLLMLPTAAADYLEYERFYLVDAIKPFIDAGRTRCLVLRFHPPLLAEQSPTLRPLTMRGPFRTLNKDCFGFVC
jgi:hypothetical protein